MNHALSNLPIRKLPSADWVAVGLAMLVLAAGAVSAQETTGPADQLWDLYRRGQFEEVAAQGKALLNTGTETAQVNLAVGRALTDLERTEEAMPFLMKAAKGDPGKTWVYAWAEVYLGACQARLGNLDQARNAWVLARDSQATRNATRNASGNLLLFGLDESFDDWTTVETDHIIFRFSPRLGIFDREGFARTREETCQKLRDWFGGGPAKKIRFFVWADPTEAQAAGMPTLGFSRPDFLLIHAFAAQTRGHELAHVIGDRALKPTRKTGLINEGISVVLDQTGRDTMERARQAVAAGLAPGAEPPLVKVEMRALWDDFGLLVDTYSYPIAGAFVDDLLAKGGKERFLVFFTDQSYDHAREIYGPDLETWIDDFQARLYGSR